MEWRRTVFRATTTVFDQLHFTVSLDLTHDLITTTSTTTTKTTFIDTPANPSLHRAYRQTKRSKAKQNHGVPAENDRIQCTLNRREQSTQEDEKDNMELFLLETLDSFFVDIDSVTEANVVKNVVTMIKMVVQYDC